MQSAPINGPAVLLITLGLLSTSCAAAPSVQTSDDPIPASRAEADAPADRKTTDAASDIPSTSNITYRPGWLAGGLLTLDGAQAQVRTFLGEPAAALEGYFVDEAAPSVGSGGRPIVSLSNRKLFMIRRQVAGARYPDSFTVDASSGEVVEAIMPSNTTRSGLSAVSDAQAVATAEEFARTRFAGFDQLTFKGTDPGFAAGGDPMSIAHWQQRSPDSGAWLPTAVSVGVDRANGRIVSYAASRADYRAPTTPKISRERAIELALSEARKDARLAHVTVNQVELHTGGPDQLLWYVELGNVPNDIFVRYFYVDALTGAILNPLGSPVG